MSSFDNQSPIEEYDPKQRRRQKKHTETPKQPRVRRLPLEQYDPDDRAQIIIWMIVIGSVTMLVFFILFEAVGITNITVNLILALCLGIVAVLLTHEKVLRRFQAEQTVETKIRASHITERFAAKYAKRNPGDHEVKWLLPGDLRNLYYDDRHHLVFLVTIFQEMFVRKYEGKHRLLRATRNLGITLVVVAVISVVVAAWPLEVRSGSSLLYAGLLGVGLVIAYTLIGLWYCLQHIRIVVTRRITAEIWDTLPWVRKREAFIYTATITEPKSEQGFWGSRLGFSDHIIETTELKPSINGWHKARKGYQLMYALNAFALKPRQAD